MSAATARSTVRRGRGRPPRLAALGLALALVAGVLGLSATQAEPGEAEDRNMALNAVPTASFTASHNNLNAINDEEHSNSGAPETSYWGTWTASGRPASQYLQYDWAKPVQLHRTVVSFWTDAAPGTGQNVTVPQSWTLDHWDEESAAWVPVTGASGFGTSRTGTNETTFDPVTTTGLRATFQAYPDSTGTSYSALGVSEWEAWGGFAEADPDSVIDVPVVHARTTPGVVPALPASLDVVRLGGRVTPVEVAWDTVAEQDLVAGAALEVNGDLTGVAESATATVWVREAPSSTIAVVDDVAVITTVGVRPVLPGVVTATYDDGSRASDVEVTWEALSRADYAAEGFFEVAGAVAGTDLVLTAWVFVQPADGSEPPPDVELATTTTATPTPAKVPYGRAARVRVEVGAADGTPEGTVSVDEGGEGLGNATLVAGRALVTLPGSLDVGSHVLTVTYAGTATHAPSTTSAVVRVTKVPARLRAKVVPGAVARGRRPKLRFTVTTVTGVPATGKVVVKVFRGKKRLLRRAVSASRKGVALPAQPRAGRYRVKVNYRGSTTVKRRAATTRYRVTR